MNIDQLIDEGAKAAGLLEEAFADAPHRPGPVMQWGFEEYSAEEIAEGILSNAGIEVSE